MTAGQDAQRMQDRGHSERTDLTSFYKQVQHYSQGSCVQTVYTQTVHEMTIYVLIASRVVLFANCTLTGNEILYSYVDIWAQSTEVKMGKLMPTVPRFFCNFIVCLKTDVVVVLVDKISHKMPTLGRCILMKPLVRSTKQEVMFLSALLAESVCLSLCLSVCSLAGLLKKIVDKFS